MKDFSGKKLLILGGVFQHCKLVSAAKELGATVYVTDFLPDSPAKAMADKSFMYNVKDVDAIVKLCRDEKIDGVLSVCIDPCQRPYGEICEKLGLPCFGTGEQFFSLTDKHAFKRLCAENGVDTIPEYPAEMFESPSAAAGVEYPVLVKPVDSRGSRGQSVCNSYEETSAAIDFAKKETETGDVIIEKLMNADDDFTVSYIVINGEPFLTRTGKRYLGRTEDRIGNVAIAGAAPAAYTDTYLKNVHPKVVRMLKNLGIKNGPMFMQGFIDGDTVRFYDPGFRFPGIEYETMYTAVYGINPLKLLTEFALSGTIDFDTSEIDEEAKLLGKRAIDLLPAIRPGRIARIEGIDKIREHPSVVSVFLKYFEGDTVGEHYNVNQRFAEIDVVADGAAEAAKTVEWIYDTLRVYDENGNDMIFGKLDTDRIY